MAAINDIGEETVSTAAVTYKKELKWKIYSFEEWWSKRENLYESEILNMKVDGTTHEFKLTIKIVSRVLKDRHAGGGYAGVDRYAEETLALGLFYNGPSDFITVKPHFFLKTEAKKSNDPHKSYTKLKKGETFSDAQVFLTYVKNDIIDGSLTIGCIVQLIVIKNSSAMSPLEKNLLEKKTWIQCLGKNFDFTASGAGSHLDVLSDFQIICTDKLENGEEPEHTFRCHKLVLSAGSRYFQAMFSSKFTERQGSTIVPDVSSDTMAKLLKYLYTGEVERNKVDVELFGAADKYQMDHLKALCELELGTNLSMANAPKLAAAAHLCGTEEFKKHIFSFVGKHWKQIKCDENYKCIVNNPDILSQLLDYVV